MQLLSTGKIRDCDTEQIRVITFCLGFASVHCLFNAYFLIARLIFCPLAMIV